VYLPTDLGLGGRVHASSLTAGMRLGGHFASGTMTAQPLLDKGKADAKEVSERTL
jgi:hypothetical protein